MMPGEADKLAAVGRHQRRRDGSGGGDGRDIIYTMECCADIFTASAD